MSTLATTTERFAFTSQALATLGGSSEWDAALSEYLHLDALTYSDDEFGAFAKANEADDLEKILVESEYGKNWRENPEAARRMGIRWEKMRAAEEVRNETFLYPMWAAARKLAATPAPTIAAAMFKANFIAREEVWNDGKFEGDCMAIVTEDFARLQGEA